MRAVLISGAGRAFMAGGEVGALRSDPIGNSTQLIESMHSGLRVLSALDAPVVASVQGAVAGAGMGVLLACDLVVGARNTRFSIAYCGIGASGDCGTTWGLPRIVGVRKALELALLGDVIDADAAHAMGLINRVVAPEELHDSAVKLAQRLAGGATRAFGQLRQLIRNALEHDLATHLDSEASRFLDCAYQGLCRRHFGIPRKETAGIPRQLIRTSIAAAPAPSSAACPRSPRGLRGLRT